MPSILRCPVCREPLVQSLGGYQCGNKHSFDAAKQGYINLLLSHQKHSKEPGDSPEMMRSRRQFLNGGFYDQLSMGLNQVLTSLLEPELSAHPSILDAGCGEGFYLKNLQDFLIPKRGEASGYNYYGLDISKYAVRQATQRDKTITWLVASIMDLPFVDASLDMILSVFSMVNFNEFHRVLKPNGKLVLATAGPRHLQSLREIIYTEVREHSQSAILEHHRGLFTPVQGSNITYKTELTSSEEIMNLLMMTPYFWNIDVITKAKIQALQRLPLEVDVCVSIFEKAGQSRESSV
jgi:23S rRNA (guanine745-N1)-methyltransferase